jgi:hypothetical protein
VKLVEGMGSLGKDIRSLQVGATRQRHLIRILGLSVALDICLSVGLGFVGYNATHAAHVAHNAAVVANAVATANKATLKATCINSNEVRSEDIKIWDEAVPLIDQVAVSPALAAATRVTILTLVNGTFASRPC